MDTLGPPFSFHEKEIHSIVNRLKFSCLNADAPIEKMDLFYFPATDQKNSEMVGSGTNLYQAPSTITGQNNVSVAPKRRGHGPLVGSG